MMKIFIWILVSLTRFALCELNAEAAVTTPHFRVRLLSQSRDAFVMEFSVDDFRLSQNLQGYTAVAIDGVSCNREPGKPSMPEESALLSVPPGAKFEVVFLEETFDSKTDIEISPNPAPDFKQGDDGLFVQTLISKQDTAVYTRNDFYPSRPVTLEILGFLRDQYLLRVKMNPAQYNPISKLLKLNRKVRFQINLQNSSPKLPQIISNGGARDEGASTFDRILNQLLLNSKQANPKFGPEKLRRDAEIRFDAIAFCQSIAATPALKIGVSQEGFHKITRHDLEEAGLDLAEANPHHIHLFNDGREIPLYLLGEEDGKFDSTDAIIFFGEANPTIYSNQNVYWLTINDWPGLRMPSKNGKPLDPSVRLSRYRAIERFEENLIYEHIMPRSKARDHWVWEEIKPGESKELRFNLSDLDGSNFNAVLRTALYGTWHDEYAFEFFLNEHEIADTAWTRGFDFFMTKSFPQSHFREGENILTIKSLQQERLVYYDWFEIEFEKRMTARDGKIIFEQPIRGNFPYEINGFASNQIDVYQVLEPNVVFRITNTTTFPDGAGFKLLFQGTVDTTGKFVCLENDHYLTPSYLSLDEPSSLRFPHNQSDYIIITHESFYRSILPLAELHRSEGMSVEVVKTQDIYDEFNYGNFHPQAIRDFLQYAYYFWKSPAPLYVLLVGDATYDYKSYSAAELKGHVPTHLFENLYAAYQTSNDNWFVCISGNDELPDMMIGRLPVHNVSELEDVIQKITDYKQNHLQASWKNTVLMVADDSPDMEDFEQTSDSLVAFFPDDFQIKSVFVRDCRNGEKCRREIIDSINDGALIVNYAGHGSPDFWARERLLRNEDAGSLYNRRGYPFTVMLTCLSGLIEHPSRDCLAEKLVTRRTGALACWAATGFVFISEYAAIGSYLYDAIFTNEDVTMGAAILQAKLAYRMNGGLSDHVEMYTLLGDPAMKLNLVNPEAPLVTWQYQGRALHEQEEYVHPNPTFLAHIRAKHPIQTQKIALLLDGKAIRNDDPRVAYIPFDSYQVELQLQTTLTEGTHDLRLVVSDSIGLLGEDRISFRIEANQLSINHIVNYPNPMINRTHFTYELSQPAEVTIKIYTIAGRLVQVLSDYSLSPFNAIEWDGRDQDGDRVANGVYLYKVIAKIEDKSVSVVERLAKIE